MLAISFAVVISVNSMLFTSAGSTFASRKTSVKDWLGCPIFPPKNINSPSLAKTQLASPHLPVLALTSAEILTA